MKQKPKFIAFSTQKGGAGKTTFTVLAASYLHYVSGYNVVVVDCDFPQFSIQKMRKRDAEQLETNLPLYELAEAQFSKILKPTYPILCSQAEDAITTANEYLESCEENVDFVLFDLPGTFNNDGVVETIAALDYIFAPIAADKVSLESTLPFASIVKDHIVDNKQYNINSIYLFWNMVDGREKTDLYAKYEEIIGKLGIPILKTAVPNTTKYKKESSDEGVNLFRSTIFPPSRVMLRGSRLPELITEILTVANLERDGEA